MEDTANQSLIHSGSGQTPILSVVISTRNRCEQLKECLNSLFLHAPLDGTFEVVVVDGASQDDTKDVLESFKIKDLPLRFLSLEENGGMDKDFIKAANLATGQFIWFASDDDLFTSGAAQVLISAIQKNTPSVLLVNYEVADPTLSNLIDRNRLNVEIDDHIANPNPDEVFDRYSGGMTYLGSTVISASTWKSFDPEPFIGSYFIHIGAIFSSPMINGLSIISEPLLRLRTGSASWKKDSFLIWNSKWASLVSQLAILSSHYKTEFASNWKKQELRRLMWLKAIGVATQENLKGYIRTISSPSFFGLIHKMILFTPRRFLVYVAILKLKAESLLNNKKVEWELHELRQ